MKRLVLQDGAAVNQEDVAFCKRLQSALKGKEKTVDIITPKDWFPSWKTKKISTLDVFDHFRQEYRVQNFVGFLNFEGRQVMIHSRFDEHGELFRYMMTRLGLMPRLAWNQSTEAELGTFQIPLVYTFLRQLKEAYAIGVYRQYQTFFYNDSHPKGCINIPMHIRKNPLENGRIAYSTREYTVDNPINRLILAAWQYICRDKVLGKTARQIIKARPDLYTAIKELNSQLNSPPPDHRQTNQIIRDASRPITHHMHLRYEQVRKTALLLLKHFGPEQSAEKSSSRVSGMLFPMDIMWEFFLKEAVLSFQEKGWKVSHEEPLGILIPEGGSPLRKIKPDFLFFQKDPMHAATVLDAKYKAIWGMAYEHFPTGAQTAALAANAEEDDDTGDEPAHNEKKPWKDARVREDSFQVMSYMHVTHAKTGAIIFPLATKHTTLPVKKLRLYAGTDDAFLLIPVCLPQVTGDFQTYCADMDERCRQLKQQLQPILLPQTN